MSTPTTDELTAIAAGIRAWVLHANKHPGGTSSPVEAITALYFSGATTLAAPDGQGDRMIYSKGHAAAPWYFVLWALGGLPGTTWEELAGFGELRHPVPRMPRRGALPGIHMSTGALGQGLSFGIGAALADRRAETERRTFVLLGDGECTEGQVWEAAMTAARVGLRNLVALVDANGSGSVIELVRSEWAPRWSGFGWHTVEIDGHDTETVAQALRATHEATQPTAIIMHTVKGKGLAPVVEGSNSLSAETSAEYLPTWDTEGLIVAALAVIDRYYPGAKARRCQREPCRAAGNTRPLVERHELLGRLRGHRVGASLVAKKALGAELASVFAGLPMLWMAPDAIRNSGLLDRMTEVGSWHWYNPTADVLQCGIAEQDAASLAAGAASAGLVPVLFSMEGFYWRMLDQIRQSIVFPQLPVLLVGTSGGLGDPLGPMVQSDGCLSALSALPGLEILEAGDINTATVLAVEALVSGRPAYLRLPHEDVPVRHELADLATWSTVDGVWVLRDDPQPQVVIAAAGSMREVALHAAEHLHVTLQVAARVVEIISPTRVARLNPHRRVALFPPEAAAVSIHNAPSTVLGSLLPAGSLSVGIDDFGLAGSPQAELYEAAGLTEKILVERILQELLR